MGHSRFGDLVLTLLLWGTVAMVMSHICGRSHDLFFGVVSPNVGHLCDLTYIWWVIEVSRGHTVMVWSHT
jgi:hypothetical protein